MSKKEIIEEEFEFIENDEDEDLGKIDYNYYSFVVLGRVKKKGNVLTRVIIVNRWLWMTDDSRLRSIYPPLSDSLSDFQEISPAVLDTNRSPDETHDYLTGLGMREDQSLKHAYKK